ncbi:MAG: 3-mercaptopyruvate sulfurtransferase [Xanthobacteraceae bacterium]
MDSSAYFVSTQWLAAHLHDPDIVVIDATFFVPDEGRNAHAEYLAGHIPGAVFFDIDAIADRTTDLPHMLPMPQAFAAAMRALGIGSSLRLIVYDNAGLQGGARVWWTLRLYGAKEVKILAGGLAKWKAEGRSLEAGEVRRAPQQFAVAVDRAGVADLEAVKRASAEGSPQIIDARPAARFRGEAPEPRPGVRSGHIPGSFSLPWREITANGELRSPQEIAAAFAKAGVDLNKPIITTCGSGVTAAILLLGLETAGKKDVSLYDGAWSEWGARTDLPVAKG